MYYVTATFDAPKRKRDKSAPSSRAFAVLHVTRNKKHAHVLCDTRQPVPPYQMPWGDDPRTTWRVLTIDEVIRSVRKYDDARWYIEELTPETARLRLLVTPARYRRLSLNRHFTSDRVIEPLDAQKLDPEPSSTTPPALRRGWYKNGPRLNALVEATEGHYVVAYYLPPYVPMDGRRRKLPRTLVALWHARDPVVAENVANILPECFPSAPTSSGARFVALTLAEWEGRSPLPARFEAASHQEVHRDDLPVPEPAVFDASTVEQRIKAAHTARVWGWTAEDYVREDRIADAALRQPKRWIDHAVLAVATPERSWLGNRVRIPRVQVAVSSCDLELRGWRQAVIDGCWWGPLLAPLLPVGLTAASLRGSQSDADATVSLEDVPYEVLERKGRGRWTVLEALSVLGGGEAARRQKRMHKPLPETPVAAWSAHGLTAKPRLSDTRKATTAYLPEKLSATVEGQFMDLFEMFDTPDPEGGIADTLPEAVVAWCEGDADEARRRCLSAWLEYLLQNGPVDTAATVRFTVPQDTTEPARRPVPRSRRRHQRRIQMDSLLNK